jgi:hypothetical protein
LKSSVLMRRTTSNTVSERRSVTTRYLPVELSEHKTLLCSASYRHQATKRGALSTV